MANLGTMRIEVKVDQTSASKGWRDPVTGRFVTHTRASLAREMLALALDTQRRVADLQTKSYRRPRGSGRLRRATLSRENIEWSHLGFGVGDIKWLETGSPARYARTIEDGSKAVWRTRPFTTLPLQGYWGSKGGVVPGIKGWQQGRFNATGGWGSSNGFYRPASWMPLTPPRKEIEPMHAYKQVTQNPAVRDKARNAARATAMQMMQQATQIP